MKMGGKFHVSAAVFAEKEPPVHIGQEPEWASEPVWIMWLREISVAPAGNRTPAIHPIACRYTD
jgi:hypothetical protein